MTKEEIKTWRIANGWTQQEMSKQFNISVKSVAFWEQGRRNIPRWLPLMCGMTDTISLFREKYAELPDDYRHALVKLEQSLDKIQSGPKYFDGRAIESS